MDNAYKTGSLIDPSKFQDKEVGKVYANNLGERHVEDNQGNLKLMAEYVGVSQGEGDFTVSYASGTMIAASGLPYTPSDENILFIQRVPATGSAETYTKRNRDIRYWTDTFFVASASFAATDHFVVGLHGQKKGFDPATNSHQVAVINARQLDYVDKQTATGSVIFGTTGWFSGSVWHNSKSYTNARVYVDYGFSGAAHAGANTLFMKLLTTADTTVSSEYDEIQNSVGSGLSDLQQNVYRITPRIWRHLNAGADPINTTASYHGYRVWRSYYDIDVNGSEGFKFALSESIGNGSTTGTLNVYYVLTNN